MQENWLQLIDIFCPNKNYVLATITDTRGATYRKRGTMMLIEQNGHCTGLLSGGCLEADISMHAEQVFESQQSKLIQYDLKADAQLLWGLGLGCEGEIDILLLPLLVSNQHLGFADMLNAIAHRKTGLYCQTVNDQARPQAHFVEQSLADIAQSYAHKRENNSEESAKQSQLMIPVSAPISVLICGAGPDVVPVVNMINQLGWRCSLWDHRAAYLEQADFALCAEKKKTRPHQVHCEDFIGFDAAVVMTHNLTSDGEYLAHLLKTDISYIGLLGPEKRKYKLLEPLAEHAETLTGRVYGPVGLDLGGRSPQAIALSIVAQIQQHMTEQVQSTMVKPWLQ